MDEPSDHHLWSRAAAGDAAAFGALYERHDRAVTAYCLWRTANPSLAQDLCSIVFLEAWQMVATVPLRSASARPLLLAIATNVVRSQRRSRRRHDAAMTRLGRAGESRPTHDDDSAARVDAARRLREIRAQLDTLPRREREVLALVALADLSYEETAEALGLPVGTVRSRLSRARGRLTAGGGGPDLSAIRPTTTEPTR